MDISIATWNINSVRLRQQSVLDYLEKFSIDILCLQETKCMNDVFPLEGFRQRGYIHNVLSGQKSYNGVAILSRFPITNHFSNHFCQKMDCRHLMVEIDFLGKRLKLHNFYVPAGGDIPDRQQNEKFGHKLDFLEEMGDFLLNEQTNTLLVGDFNVAPLPDDVWSHKQLLNVVSHTEIECVALAKVQQKGNFVDIVREKWPEPQKVYSWWSYRAQDWEKSNRGRRLDHIWSSQDLSFKVKDIFISKAMRSLERPSDHVPIHAIFTL